VRRGGSCTPADTNAHNGGAAWAPAPRRCSSAQRAAGTDADGDPSSPLLFQPSLRSRFRTTRSEERRRRGMIVEGALRRGRLACVGFCTSGDTCRAAKLVHRPDGSIMAGSEEIRIEVMGKGPGGVPHLQRHPELGNRGTRSCSRRRAVLAVQQPESRSILNRWIRAWVTFRAMIHGRDGEQRAADSVKLQRDAALFPRRSSRPPQPQPPRCGARSRRSRRRARRSLSKSARDNLPLVTTTPAVTDVVTTRAAERELGKDAVARLAARNGAAGWAAEDSFAFWRADRAPGCFRLARRRCCRSRAKHHNPRFEHRRSRPPR
jgi:hypothetical protein